MFAQGLSIRAAGEDETVAAVAELCCCPGGCCSRGQWEGDSLWSREWLCLDKAKGRSWQDSWGPGSRAARPGPQHPLCSLWFSCFFANCLAWVSLSIRQSCGLYGCWTGLPVPSESSFCWCWRLEAGGGRGRSGLLWQPLHWPLQLGDHGGLKQTAVFSCCYCFI